MTVSSPPVVEPAYKNVPPYTSTLGPEVSDLNRLAGFGPDPEQEMVLDAIFALGPHDQSAAFEVGVVACRQNLKTGIFKQAAIGWLFLTGERLVVWSAHEFATSAEAFRDLEELVTGSDYLRRRVRKISHANGEEAIELRSGSRLIFKTRTKGGGRGLTGSKVILDEAFALRAMHMGALLPTMSAQPDPQVLYGSSAGLADSDVLRGLRDRGRRGNDLRLAYFEWCAPPPKLACKYGDGCLHALTSEGCGCDNPEYWRMGNPAMGRRITVEYIAAERRAMPPAEFGRERMGWWDDPAEGTSPISTPVWQACGDPKSVVQDPVAVAFEVSGDRSMSAIAVCGARADGRLHGEVVEHQPGTGWLMDRLDSIVTRANALAVVFDPSGPAGMFEKELNRRGYQVKPRPGSDDRRLQIMGAREYAAACGALADDVVNDRFRHIDQAQLNAAVEGVRTRPLADAWAWSRKGSAADITPLVAVTLARHGFATYGTTAAPEPFFLV